MTLRDRIRELANSRGMSLPVLEATLGFGNGTIVKWDKSSPNTDKLQMVADYFNVSLDYLLGRESQRASDGINKVYLNLAREAQESAIDPNDLKLIMETIKSIRKDQNK